MVTVSGLSEGNLWASTVVLIESKGLIVIKGGNCLFRLLS